LWGTVKKERVGCAQECIGAHLDQLRKRRVDVRNGAGVQDRDLPPKISGRGLGRKVPFCCREQMQHIKGQ
jgi:hypothetical protein